MLAMLWMKGSTCGKFRLGVSHILFVDQPIGTSFYYTSDDGDIDIRHDEVSVGHDLMTSCRLFNSFFTWTRLVILNEPLILNIFFNLNGHAEKKKKKKNGRAK
ncbi:hypothetical protein PIB30_025630 [Stylosanthes scabra]|uniref:Uncharacterized protein n=1 Tax=Stylosanthes scabra TaxID=79078 RepID=A0ABU6U9J3_9FABA|nr:hypothetical protein [Stylosanthes scabra]